MRLALDHADISKVAGFKRMFERFDEKQRDQAFEDILRCYSMDRLCAVKVLLPKKGADKVTANVLGYLITKYF
mgnify:CR=1 FL=1